MRNASNCPGIRLSFFLPVLLVYQSLAFAQDAANPAWRNFQHALGQPAMIGANAGHELAGEITRPLPQPDPRELNPARFALGASLFHEGRLSTGNSIACITCHAGALSGTDRRQVSLGVGGAPGRMNALSVFNATFNFRQFWDGRAVTLEDQALLPIEADFEMANSLDSVAAMLQESEYRARFEAIYPDGVTILNMADAIAHFQRFAFIRLDTPFQRYLNGQESALTGQELRGWRRFNEIGCSSCHNGINLGGNSYQKLGDLVPYYGDGRTADVNDGGVMDRTGLASHRFLFRVPPLHGVATTPPYFHDGSIATLDEAVRLMAEHQLGRQLEDFEADDIGAFLRSLGGYFTTGQKAMTTTMPAQTSSARQVSDRQSHREAYVDAIMAIDAAVPRLIQEVEKLVSSQVAHFDFLQFQHRELLRLARALQYPPDGLDTQIRQDLQENATRLLTEVQDLEWLIADFLMVHARIGVLTALSGAAPDTVQIPELSKLLDQQLAIRLDYSRNLENLSYQVFTSVMTRLIQGEPLNNRYDPSRSN